MHMCERVEWKDGVSSPQRSSMMSGGSVLNLCLWSPFSTLHCDPSSCPWPFPHAVPIKLLSLLLIFWGTPALIKKLYVKAVSYQVEGLKSLKYMISGRPCEEDFLDVMAFC